MKQYLRILFVLVLMTVLTLANPVPSLADEGKGGHSLEVEVNDFHVTLSNQNKWVKGENVVIVTLLDVMGMPVSGAEVDILITPKQADSHAESELDSHGDSQTDVHGSEPSHESVSDMDDHEGASPDVMAHDEETVTPLVMTESHEHGEYVTEAYLEKSGEHVVQVFFHVNGEMMQADFLVNVPGIASKTLALWSFLLINVGIVVTAGVMKNQSFAVKGK